MEAWKHVMLDDESMWPPAGKVPLPEAHADARGAIQPIANLPMKNVSLISSARGTVRSNHYHLTDWHYMYVMKGAFDYHARPAGSSGPPLVTRVSAGEMIFTPPMEEHATHFLEDSELLVVSRNPRDQESYEADTRRVTLLDPASVEP
jgi:quercetin dioxygenase-like cupin family protein